MSCLCCAGGRRERLGCRAGDCWDHPPASACLQGAGLAAGWRQGGRREGGELEGGRREESWRRREESWRRREESSLGSQQLTEIIQDSSSLRVSTLNITQHKALLPGKPNSL